MTGDLRLAGPLQPFPRERLGAHALDAARALLGAVVVSEQGGDRVVARVVETEAYRQGDPASHSHTRRTARSEPMFWRPGTAYVYRSYGVHWCWNVTAEPAERGAAVLLRAAVLLDGADVVVARRPAVRRTADLLRGPGNLTRGLGIDGRHDRGDVVDGTDGLALRWDGWGPDERQVRVGPRVGVRLAPDAPWRLWIADVPEVSRHVRSPRALGPLTGRTGPDAGG